MTRLMPRLRWLSAGTASAVVVAVLGTAAFSRQTGGDTGRNLTVHEWGTFTSVAGLDGGAQAWTPFASPLELPCFVRMINDNPKVILADPEGPPPILSRLRATVRMETPVMYFYSPAATTVDVGVSFPHGLITEWYPHALVSPGMTPATLSATATINWNGIRVLPTPSAAFPEEPGANHYYAARATDANALQNATGTETEKFLFYRGMADFPVINVKPQDNGGVVWSPAPGMPAPEHLILFENRGGRLAFRRVDAPIGKTAIAAPEPASFEALRVELERLLTAQGLYPREAQAMVETWRDSWFEEGTRLFYLMPQAAVDAVLPMSVYPTPAHRVRTFVGRVEVITPTVQFDVQRAFATSDMNTLTKYARFLEPIAARIMPSGGTAVNPARLSSVQAAIAAAHQKPSCR